MRVLTTILLLLSSAGCATVADSLARAADIREARDSGYLTATGARNIPSATRKITNHERGTVMHCEPVMGSLIRGDRITHRHGRKVGEGCYVHFRIPYGYASRSIDVEVRFYDFYGDFLGSDTVHINVYPGMHADGRAIQAYIRHHVRLPE